MGLEGIVSKRLGSRYRSGRSPDWLKFKNPACEAVGREAEEDWGKAGRHAHHCRREARDWCRTHHSGSPITEIGPGGKRAAPKKPTERPSR
jgi:ATP-dependent DNA ligase